MHLHVFALAQTHGQAEGIATTFGVDWPHLIAQIVSFSIVCAVLYVLAYKPILQMLKTRREQIAQGLANAAQIKQELARIEIERLDILAKADAAGRQILEDSRAAAVRAQAESTRRATADAELILANAREAAARDHARMLAELKRHIGRLVIQTSEAVTGRILTPDDQRRLSEETARRLAS